MESYHITTVSDAIRTYRAAHKISQQKLSELTGISRVTIGAIEREKVSPTIATIDTIFKKMGYYHLTINIS